MDDVDLGKLITGVEKLPYPLRSNKGHNSAVLGVFSYDVKICHERSLSQSRSRRAVASVRSKSSTKSLPEGDEEEEEVVVPKNSKGKVEKECVLEYLRAHVVHVTSCAAVVASVEWPHPVQNLARS